MGGIENANGNLEMGDGERVGKTIHGNEGVSRVSRHGRAGFSGGEERDEGVEFEWATRWDDTEEREGGRSGACQKSGDGGRDAGGIGEDEGERWVERWEKR